MSEKIRELSPSEHPALKHDNPQTSDDVMRVEMTYDLKTNDFKLKAPNVPTVMLYGIIEMGLCTCVQRQVHMQVMGSLTKMAAAARDKITVTSQMPETKEPQA